MRIYQLYFISTAIIQYHLQVTQQMSASDTRVVYAPLASQFLAHVCTLTSALEYSRNCMGTRVST